ncbi:hypothetical protein [Flavihumibacter sp.]|uniref:hypothetical protein n=1 Tax=Flavihumibacter sp. TaxID=1913981 RepID=UPI002FC92CC3|nr:hypothetical protein [Flavihumibacter sediminis]
MEKTSSPSRKPFRLITFAFALVNILLIVFRSRLEPWGLDTNVLLYGNIFLFLIFLISGWMHFSAAGNKSTQVFMRSMYGGMILKLFGIAIAAFIYIYIARENVNKPALFGFMFLYLLYTFIELRIVLKQTK